MTTRLGGLQAVTAPPATPPVYGLLKAATIVTDDVHWQSGIKWSPEQIGGGFAGCLDCGGGSVDLDQATNPIVGHAEPFLIYAEDHCSTFGFGARDYEARARRQLAAVESALIAHEFQTGDVGGDCTPALDNVALEDGVDLGGSGVPVIEAFALLEQALAEKFDGRRCMLHVTPGTMTEAKAAFLVELTGGVWITALGSIVVADAGYRPISAAHWAYGTSLVQIRESPVEVPNTFEESVDRANNSVVVYAERLALVQYDSGVVDDGDAVFKIEVDTPVNPGS